MDFVPLVVRELLSSLSDDIDTFLTFLSNADEHDFFQIQANGFGTKYSAEPTGHQLVLRL